MATDPSFCSWDGFPCRWLPGEAWAFLKGSWTRVDDADVGMSARVVSEHVFARKFGSLPPLPALAFQFTLQGSKALP